MWSLKTLKHELNKKDKHISGARGQHFMTDAGFLERIVNVADVEPGNAVLEVGTGPGHLTCTLLDAGALVAGVEIDDTLAELCRKQTDDPEELSIYVGDLMSDEDRVHPDVQVMVRNIIKRTGSNDLTLVSNLPYRRGPSMLIALLESPFPLTDTSTVVLQTELAEKLQAMPGTSDFGIPSVLFQWNGQMEIIQNVPKDVFWPTPEVDSVLCRVTNESEWVNLDVSYDTYFEMKNVVRELFRHPRKTLRNNIKLSDAYQIDDVEMYGSFVDLFLDKRPEQLTPREWHDLTTSLLNADDRNDVDVDLDEEQT